MTTQPRLVNKQFNTPIGLYSTDNVQEVLHREQQLLANGAVGIDFYNQQVGKPANLQNSAVLRMLEEEENRRGGRAGNGDYHSKVRDISWPPSDFDHANRLRSSFKDVVIPGVKRVAWPPPQEGVLDPAELTEHNAVQSQGGPQYSNQTPGLPQNNYSPQQATPYQQPSQPSYRPLKPLDISSVGTGSPLASPALNQSPSGYRSATPSKGWAPVHSPATTPLGPGSQKYFGAPEQGYQSQPQQQAVSQPYQQPGQAHGQPARQQHPVKQSQGYQEPGRQYGPVKHNQAPSPSYQQPGQHGQQYQQPGNYNQAAPQSYEDPNRQYSLPAQQYQPSGPQYQQPNQYQQSNQYQQPNQYQQAPQQYQPAPQQYQQPPQQYQQPPQQYQQPPQQYQQPPQQYQQPPQQYQQPPQQHQQPPQQYQQPPTPQYQSPQPQQYQSQSFAQPAPNQNQAPFQPAAAQAQAAPKLQPAKQVEPPPSTITLRPSAPVSQAPAPVYSTQPATATLKGGKHLRGDLKWPPENVRQRMAEEKQQLEELEKGPANRPHKREKDYSRFFAEHALNDAYPGYKIPPGTQFYRPE